MEEDNGKIKINIEFNPKDHEQVEYLKTVARAEDMKSLIWELKHNFWRQWKYKEESPDYEDIRGAIYDLLEEFEMSDV